LHARAAKLGQAGDAGARLRLVSARQDPYAAFLRITAGGVTHTPLF
jgi:hypothetical protein